MALQRRNLFVLAFVGALVLMFAGSANAQTMMFGNRISEIDWNEVIEHTKQEELQGKALWSKLQAKQTECDSLLDEEFGMLGEYFMGQMTGSAHAAMNAMLLQMHGERGEELMHIALGKRLSGCDVSASVFGLQMPMMMSGFGPWTGGSNDFNLLPINNYSMSMMNYGLAGFIGWLFMFLWWVLIVAGIIALAKWVMGKCPQCSRKNAPIEILKERYAKGEIDEKEFARKKKALEMK